MSRFKTFLGSTTGLIACALAAALGVYLMVYHLTHVALLLPYLILLACPLMHLMHRGHGHGGGKNGPENGRYTSGSCAQAAGAVPVSPPSILVMGPRPKGGV